MTTRNDLYKIFGILFILLIATVAVSWVDLGEFNFVIAMAIAITKALLVVLFFMEVKYSGQTTKLIAAAAVLWLILLLLGTIMDIATRHPEVMPLG